MIALCEDNDLSRGGCSARCCWVITNFGLFFFQLSGIVTADIDEGTVTPHPNAEIPRLPCSAVSLYKFRYFDFAFIAPHTTHTALQLKPPQSGWFVSTHLTPEIPYHCESSIKIILKRKTGGKVTPNLTVGLTTCDLFSNIFRNKRGRWLTFAW